MDKKIELLYSAISDAQELIRFIDTKTAIAITILAAYVVAFFSCIETIVKYSSSYSCWFWFFLFIFFIFFIFCIIVTTRIIKPTFNPIDNIDIGVQSTPILQFFLYPNNYANVKFYPFANSKKFKLGVNFETYNQQLVDSSETDIVKSLTLELFKISYIRNIKNDRFNILVLFLVGLTVSFFISYFIYSIETQHIKTLIELSNHHCLGC